jgi:oligopeptide transport system substrate-binding protein
MNKLLVLLLTLVVAAGAFAGGQEESTAGALPTFTILSGAEPPTLDSSLMEDTTSSNIHLALFENLLIYDPKTNDGIPGLAESWTVSEDRTTYTFKLRKTTWSDGTPITAKTVVDSWLRTLNPETASPYAWMMGMVVAGADDYAYGEGKVGPEVVKIRALDTYTFQVDLVGPVPYVLGMLPHSIFGVLPIHVIEKYGDEWTLPGNMVSNGPFVLEEWKPQEILTVVKNDKYWDAANVKLGKIIFIPSDDNNTRYNMYLNGEADWMRGGIPDEQLDIAKLRPDYQAFPQLGTYFFEFNHTMKPLNDVRVRKALSIAIDRQELVDKVSRGGQIPAFRVTPPLAGYTPPKDLVESVEQAKQLLAQAGYPNGQGFPELTVLYNTSTGHQRIVEYLQQEWEKNLNIEVKIENAEWKTVLARGANQEFQILRMGWIGDYQDANTFLELFQTDAGQNYGKYSNAQFDSLIKRASTMPGGAARFDVLKQAEEIFINQDMGIMPIYHYVNIDLIDTDKWGGWYPTTLGWHPWKFVYLK